MHRSIDPLHGSRPVTPSRAAWLLRIVFGIFLTGITIQLGLALFGGSGPSPQEGATVVGHADFIVSDSLTLPSEKAGWQGVTLPHRFIRPTGAELPAYWYRVNFTLPAIGPLAARHKPLWLYLPNLTGGGQVVVNGALIASMQSADSATQVRLYRPHLFLLPPFALRDGVNQITLHFASREPHTSVGAFEIGPEPVMRARFERRLFFEATIADTSATICLMAGLAALAFWLRRTEERLYGLLALTLLFWGLRTLVVRWPVIPMGLLTEWRFAYYVCHAGFVVSISIFTLNFSHTRMPRLERFLIVYAVAGCLTFAIFGMPLRPFMDSYWILGAFPPASYCIGHLALWAARQRTRSGLAMGAAMLLALVLCMHDFGVQEGWFHLADIYLMHLGIPVFLLVMAGVLSERFFVSLQAVESVNERLALRIDERERELARAHERVRHLGRVQGATEERRRIVQDMHDGVGSQLLTTMAIVERGSASRIDTVALLQACLDDMRLAIDSLTPEQPDLLPALGNFRLRMQTRFADAGILLHWHDHDLPASLELGTHTGLQVLRILQEALANTLKHAQANNVTVELRFAVQRLSICVSDDGIGFCGAITASGKAADAGVPRGRGLSNMQNRAARIGATLSIDRLAVGTSLQLAIPCVF